MAKLKIPTNVAPTATHPDGWDHTIPNEQGYVNIVDNLILNEEKYYEFFFADETERADLLQIAAGNDQNSVKCDVVHEVIAQPVNEFEKINNTNSLIKGERDKKKKKNSGKPSRYTIPFPDTRPYDVDYLQKYAQIIHALYQQNTVASKKRAHKFIFGMMLLTRCR